MQLLTLLKIILLNIKVKITGQTRDDGTKNVEIMVPLKYFLENSRNAFN